MNETEIYFRSLYGERPNGWLWVGAFGAQGGAIGGRFVQSAQEAASHALTLDSGGHKGVYHSLATYAEIPAERGSRGTRDEVGAVYAFALDADLAGPGHKDKKLPYPNTRDEVSELVQAAGMPEPTTWVFSGGGYYPQWALDEPIIIDSPERRAEVTGWYTGLSKRIIGVFASRGYQLDSTFDLARVYRVPGTTNRKTDTPVMCAVWSTGGGTVAEAKLRSLSAPARGENKEVGERAAPAFDDPFVTGDQIKAPARSAVTDLVRVFTPEAAERYRTKLDAMFLRDGEEIGWNNAINRYGFAMARMVAFWSRDEVAEHMLTLLTPVTGWTALDENDERTLNSGYDGFARSGQPLGEVAPAGLPEPKAATVQGDAVDALIAEMLTPGQIKDRPRPAPLIEGYLSMDSESWLIGAPGSKKSFVALDMALHVAAGMRWQGLRTASGRAIYIVAEGVGGVGDRVKAWEKQHGRDGPDALLFLPRPVQAANVGDWAVLVEACRRLKPVMVVIDTQARVTAGLEENGATDMGIYVQAQSAIREATGACVLTVHHTNKAGIDARGSSALNGAQTTELTVAKLPGQKLGGKIRTTKQKDLPELDDLMIGFVSHVVGVTEEGKDITSLAMLPAGDPKIKEFLDASRKVNKDEEDAADLARLEASKATAVDVINDRPDPWILAAAPESVERQQLLMVLRDVGQEEGLTQADAIRSVAERWYGGKVSGAKGQPGVSRSVLKTAWGDFLHNKGPSGEGLLVKVGASARAIINPMAL